MVRETESLAWSVQKQGVPVRLSRPASGRPSLRSRSVCIFPARVTLPSPPSVLLEPGAPLHPPALSDGQARPSHSSAGTKRAGPAEKGGELGTGNKTIKFRRWGRGDKEATLKKGTPVLPHPISKRRSPVSLLRAPEECTQAERGKGGVEDSPSPTRARAPTKARTRLAGQDGGRQPASCVSRGLGHPAS